MSVIQTIRDRGTWIIFVIIAVALIAFILQDGAGRGGSAFSNSSVIAKVNGTSIERGAFEERLKSQEAMYAGQGATRDQLIGTVYNMEVDNIVLNQEFDKLGLTVSAKELNDILFGENSPLRQEFTDPKTGEFKVDDAKRAFAQIKKSKNAEQIKMINSGYIEPTIQNSLRNKYQNLLIQSVYVPKWMVEKQQADNNAVASASYVYYPYVALPDSSVKVSEADINKYVKKHSNEFKKEEETRSIAYVTFSAAPTSADSAATLAQINDLKAEFAASSDAAAFLGKVGTELAFYNSYFGGSRIQVTNKDSIIRLPIGGLFGPYVDGNNYVIAKMVGIKQWPDSVTVRHILIGTNDPQSGQQVRDDSTGKKLVDSIQTAIKNGADFNAMVSKYSDDGGSKEKGGVYDYFPQGQMVIPFNDFAFDNQVGAKGVVKTDFGYHYIEILGQKNRAPAYKIAYLAKPIISSNETMNEANTAAATFASGAKGTKEFNDNAAKLAKPILSATEIKQNDFTVGTMANTRSLVRWIYENKEGAVSDPTEVGDQIIVAMVTNINKAGLMGAAEARPLVEGLIRNDKKAKIIIDSKMKGSSLEEIAKSSGSSILRADSLSFGSGFINGVGNEPKIVGAAFNKVIQGKASSLIAGNSGVFAVKGETIAAKAADALPETVKQALIQNRKMAIYRSIEALRKAATVKDYRFSFY
ncbi:peptidylprolyl isomerase [Sediminibacterium sp.]|uniref:peptidylprolyl isomerase n=1 Tax=Sediminibacterium sp. TaxID=1917865 RepID=UPI002736AFC1|nr:peptidylprolyl isomerase [Sediminibacterium sp.]MDP3394631.1 peptidylprolyl isomerase [Sediminibacterium sp.]MDP3568466.1 peptidylprolyl isomerase [Sediminibacterium sp.]